MIPVEKMAARLLNRHNLKPPFNLEALASNYASIEYHEFPFSADGITIGIGGNERPQILINSHSPETRKKFTLAHELGHVIIPWHTGTIISHLNHLGTHLEYRDMESEANQFAAELLIPQSWLHGLEDNFYSVEALIKTVLKDTGVSRDAAFIKIFNTIRTPIVCAWIHSNGDFIKDFRTNTAPSSASFHGKNILNQKIFLTASSEEIFTLGDRLYKAWMFDQIKFDEIDPRPWRDILNQILDETGKQHLLGSINAILPNKYCSNKDMPEQELCSLVMQTYDGRDNLNDVVSHPLFSQYIIKRIKELVARNKK
ncbi:hypothetical protein D3C79_584860 [compost metagenome]